MEIVLLANNSKELTDVRVRARASFARLRAEFPTAESISWHTLMPGSSCVYNALPDIGLDGSMRLVAEIDGLWTINHDFEIWSAGLDRE